MKKLKDIAKEVIKEKKELREQQDIQAYKTAISEIPVLVKKLGEMMKKKGYHVK